MRFVLQITVLAVFTITGSAPAWASTNAVDTLLKTWRAGGLVFSAAQGAKTWQTPVGERSCLSCHGDSVYTSGRHQRTGKVIEPMAPSVNPERLTVVKKINKWLKRNCKWTYQRECTDQEKGDILLWLSDL